MKTTIHKLQNYINYISQSYSSGLTHSSEEYLLEQVTTHLNKKVEKVVNLTFIKKKKDLIKGTIVEWTIFMNDIKIKTISGKDMDKLYLAAKYGH